MSKHFSILLIQPESPDSLLLNNLFREEIFALHHLSEIDHAWSSAHETLYDLIVVDFDILSQKNPFQVTAIEVVKHLKGCYPETAIILLTSQLNRSHIGQILQHNPAEVLLKPYEVPRLIHAIYCQLAAIIDYYHHRIESEHRQLFTLLGQIKYKWEHDHNPTIFGDLKTALQNHFKFEEYFMAYHNYPKLHQHIETHRLVGRVMQRLLNMDITTLNSEERQHFYDTLVAVLNDMKHDQEFLAFIADLKESVVRKQAVLVA